MPALTLTCWFCSQPYPETYFLPAYDAAGQRVGRRSLCKFCSTASPKPFEQAQARYLNLQLDIDKLRYPAAAVLRDLSSTPEQRAQAADDVRRAITMAQDLQQARRRMDEAQATWRRAQIRLANISIDGPARHGRASAAPSGRVTEELQDGCVVYRYFKTCSVCRQEKTTDEFYRLAGRSPAVKHPDSCRSTCKECHKKAVLSTKDKRAAKRTSLRKQCSLCLEFKPYDRFPSKTGKASSAAKKCDTCQAEVAANKRRRKLSIVQKHDSIARRKARRATSHTTAPKEQST